MSHDDENVASVESDFSAGSPQTLLNLTEIHKGRPAATGEVVPKHKMDFQLDRRLPRVATKNCRHGTYRNPPGLLPDHEA
ncbi:hypothetical protein ACQY1M_23995 (plasmid) [Neorhizobium sp. DAR64861/K0K2]